MTDPANTEVTPSKYSDDLKAISDRLLRLFERVDPSFDVSDEQEAYDELKRLAGLQLIRLHSGQAIMRQIDSMIRSWRRSLKFGGGSSVQAAHYLDCLQQVRVAIFGEPLANDEGMDERIVPDIEEEFAKFVKVNQVDKKELAAARKGFEAAFADDVVLFLETGVVSVNGELFRKMDEKDVKKYAFK